MNTFLSNFNLLCFALFLIFGAFFFFLVWFPGIFLLSATFFGAFGAFLTRKELKTGGK